MQEKNKETIAKRLRKAIEKIGTMNIVLVLVGVFFVWFNWEMIQTYRQYGDIPETYACAVIAATIGECGICGWIRTNKDRRRDRKWEKEDREEQIKEEEENDL